MPKYYMPFGDPVNLGINRLITKYSIHIYLQAIRVSKHLTQEEAATMAGLSVSTVSAIETGGNVTLRSIIRYAQALGYDIMLVKDDRNEY